jgi:hypothetical protein
VRLDGEVFARFMKPGKPGYVKQQWLPMAEAIAVIRAAGGRAVLAHPGRYEVDQHGGANGLLKAFADAGGEAVEVVCAAHHPPEWAQYAALSRKFNLLASIGSDFPACKAAFAGDLPRLSPTPEARLARLARIRGTACPTGVVFLCLRPHRHHRRGTGQLLVDAI